MRRDDAGRLQMRYSLLMRLIRQLYTQVKKKLLFSQAVINRTARKHNFGPGELQLIQSKKDIENPTIEIRAERLDPPVCGVIFDMDGTLTLPGQIDTAGAKVQLGVPPESDLLSYVGMLPEGEEKQAALDVVAAVEEAAGMELQPGVKPTLEALRAKGVPMAIATRNSAKTVSRLLEVSGLDASVFHTVVTREDEFQKPDPRVVGSIALKWGIQPTSLLMVGDTLRDIRCGREAGAATCLLVNPGFNDHHAEDGDKVDYAIHSLSELMEIVEESTIRSPPHSPLLKPLSDPAPK